MHLFEPTMSTLTHNWGMVDTAISGMDEAELARQPNADSNSSAWTLWHMNRVLDTFVHQRFRDLPQLWTNDGWAAKFGMADDPADRGVGWTGEQVAAWDPPPARCNWVTTRPSSPLRWSTWGTCRKRTRHGR